TASSEYLIEEIPGEQVDLTGMTCEDYGDGYISCYPGGDDVDDSYVDDSFFSDDEGGWATFGDTIASADVPGVMFTAFFSGGPHSGGTMEILGSGGLAIAIISFLVLTGERLRYVLLPLAAVGSMPLTAYSAHVIAIWIVVGPGGWNQPELLYPFLAVGLLIVCSIWAILVGRGPLERLTAWAATRLTPAQ